MNSPRIEAVEIRAAEFPVDPPESDGTYTWSSTTMLLARVRAGGQTGLGYSYGNVGAARLARSHLASRLQGRDALDVPAMVMELRRAVRNEGQSGLAAIAISMLDVALWDLKARLVGLPLLRLLGAARPEIPGYGSGGFTSLTEDELQDQLGGWVRQGFRMVKMKVGREAGADPDRVRAARAAIGPDVQLFVDANGGYARKQALALAERFVEQRVSWFEEPVSSDDSEGLRLLRNRLPPGMEVAAGEYAFRPPELLHLLGTNAVDVLQADATRCGGVTGFLQASALCQAYSIPLSAHTAPSLHATVACASPVARHIEYFHDHVRIEGRVLDGAPRPTPDGLLAPDPDRPGLGLELKEPDWARYEVKV